MPHTKPAENWIEPTATPLAGIDDEVIAQIAATRGWTTEETLAIVNNLGINHDPFALRGMDATVAVIERALKEQRKIVVYGDFDADGVSALAVLVVAFRSIGIEVDPYIPLRSEGYGLHDEPIAELGAKYQKSCLISVDCGTSSDDVAAGRPKDMLMAITDHHLPRRDAGVEVLASTADSLINPKQEHDTYPFQELSGSGVAYKLVQALEARGIFPGGTADKVVGYAALGTISDMMELRDENRTIVLRGLASIKNGDIPGLRAFMRRLKIPSTATSGDMSFKLIPKINSAGRMQDANLALRLFIAQSESEAAAVGEDLIALDDARKSLLAQAVAEAVKAVEAMPGDPRVVVLNTEDLPLSRDPEAAAFMPAIAGLIAGRIADRFQCTAFVVDGKTLRGSARTRDDVNVKEALEWAAKSLSKYGGHAKAAGFTVNDNQFDAFQKLIAKGVTRQLDPNTKRTKDLRIDKVLGKDEIDIYLPERLKVMEPFGPGNPKPLLGVYDAAVLGAPRQYSTRTGTTFLRFQVRDKYGQTFNVVSWGDERDPQSLVGAKVDLCGRFDINVWSDRSGEEHRSLEMTLEALRFRAVRTRAPQELGAA